MYNHFCTCPATSCDKHPSSHDKGCDLCIQKNLGAGEIPACFWILVGGDMSDETKFSIECFVDYFERNRDQYLQTRKAGEGYVKKLNLHEVAGEFEMISSETYLFYNKETNEFDFYSDYMSSSEIDTEKFEDDAWIGTPRPWDIDEYNMMVNFAENIPDSHKSELLCVALEGKGAFRRFKDTLHRVDLTEDWYAFKRKAYVEIAKEWCEENGLAYSE